MRESANGRFRPHYIQLFYFFHVRFFPTILFNPRFPSSVHAFIFFLFFIVPYYTREDRIFPYDGGRRSITTRWYIVIIITSHRRPANHSRPSRRTFVFFSESILFVLVFKRRLKSAKNRIDFFLFFFFVPRLYLAQMPCVFLPSHSQYLWPLDRLHCRTRMSLLTTTFPFLLWSAHSRFFLFSYFYNIFDYHLVNNASLPDGSKRDVL